MERSNLVHRSTFGNCSAMALLKARGFEARGFEAYDFARSHPGGALGLSMVLEGRRAIGIFTDGDLRRQLRAGAVDLQAPVSAFMIAAPRTIAQGRLAVDALNELQARKINAIGVTDVNGDLQGIVTLHGLIAAKIL
jgi:CBS domain-containing protein